MKNSLNNKFFSKAESLWSFFFPFSILFVQYGYGFGNSMLTYCLLFAGYCAFRYSEFPIFKPLSVYTLFYICIILSTVFIYGHKANWPYWMHLMQIIVSGYCVTIIAKHLDKDALYKSWKLLGLIVCVVVAYQFFRIFFLHQSVQAIRLLPVSNDALLRNENWTSFQLRPVAFFTEPSMVVSFLAPILLLAQQKKELFVSIIVSIAILLSGSTSGVVGLGIIWGFSIFSYNLSKKNKIFIVLLSIAAVIAFITLPYFSASFEKVNYELSGESSNMNVRMLRGWWIYGVLDIRSQLFGISDYNISSFVYGNASEFTWQTGYEDNFYLNTAQRIFIQTGVVGAILYVWMLIKLWVSTNKTVKPYLAFVIVSMFFGSEFYISGLFVMQFIIILSYLKKFDGDKGVLVKKKRLYVQKNYQ